MPPPHLNPETAPVCIYSEINSQNQVKLFLFVIFSIISIYEIVILICFSCFNFMISYLFIKLKFTKTFFSRYPLNTLRPSKLWLRKNLQSFWVKLMLLRRVNLPRNWRFKDTLHSKSSGNFLDRVIFHLLT